jgi:hypothetical protein
MPPSSPGAGSVVWRTAQRTIKNSATTGIFSSTISQMNVHASTHAIVYPRADPYKPRAQATPLNCVIACSSTARASISSRVSCSTRSVPNCSTLNEASTVA